MRKRQAVRNDYKCSTGLNIIPIFQPPHSPELNPIERFWEFLKTKLQWENCKTLSQLREKLAEVLETITPEVVISLTSYNFILEGLFSAAS
ncbi:transposase [Calothrix sp. CCY 0018]|uniref:transposase n=1 Tax=Calothrix sp. CCY 0018 TaxID=3103864 RepID=UPI0039C6C371